MITSNRRIFLAIFLSLVIFFGIKYLYSNPQILSPDNIYASIIQKTAELKTKISSIKIPNLSNFFSLKFFLPSDNMAIKQYNNSSQSFSLPTVIQPTLTNFKPTPTNKPSPTRRPTAAPRPTATPRPTAIPPTSTPAPEPIASDSRPGTTLEEIFEEVNKRICVPVALLRAFQEKESGAWVKYSSFNPIPYNSYGWWTDPAGPDPCKGIGYDETTGYTFPDMAIQKRCVNPLTTNPGQTGIFSISQWEQDTSRKNTVAFLPNNIDRRVMFDNALIFASITVNRVTEPECGEDWSDDVVRLAAEKHLGSCGHNYCDDVLNYYKQYK